MFENTVVDNKNLDHNGCAELHNAAGRNDLSQVKQLLSQGTKIDVRDMDYRTPLHHAANKNLIDSHIEVAKFLLESGAYVNAADYEGETPLHLLVRKGNVKIVQLFLNFNADAYAMDSDEKTPLFPAICCNKNVDVVQLLIDHGLDVNHRISGAKTPMYVACENLFVNGGIKTVKCLLKNGANVSLFDEEGSTPLIHAVRMSNWSKLDKKVLKKNLKFIMEHTNFNAVYSDVNILTFNYFTPLKDYLWKMILEHLAKLETLNVSVHPSILSTIAKNGEYNNYYKQCQEELLRAKNTQPQDCWITFYNLLVDDSKKLKNYAGSENLIEDAKKNDLIRKFPIYGAVMADKLNKGIKRRELFDQSVDLLNKCLPIFNPTHLIIRDVVDYIISKKGFVEILYIK